MLARGLLLCGALTLTLTLAASVKPEESSNLLAHHEQGTARLTSSSSTSTTTGLITVGSNFATLTVNPQSVLASLLAGASVAAIGLAIAAAIAIPLGIVGGVFAADGPDYDYPFIFNRRESSFSDFDLADASKSSYTSYRSLDSFTPALQRLYDAYVTYRDEGEVTFTF